MSVGSFMSLIYCYNCVTNIRKAPAKNGQRQWAAAVSAKIEMDNLQHQRVELKYLIHDETARAVRDFASSYLAMDEFSAGRPDFSYPVHSLYLDSDNLDFYWHTINGNKNRHKLRLRYYDASPGSPVYCEIKRRINGAILKQRGAVRRDAVDALLAGQLPEPAQMFSNAPEAWAALERFCGLMQHYHARPKAHVAYRREAWVCPTGNATRVTMDRQIHFAFEPTARLRTEMRNPLEVFPNGVVLELKFTGRFPDWFKELVRCFNLWQCSAAKYVDGATLLMESGRDLKTIVGVPPPEIEEKLQRRRLTLKKIRQPDELAATP
jgi:SPX domain protein involved in polyphosphate accumulation